MAAAEEADGWSDVEYQDDEKEILNSNIDTVKKSKEDRELDHLIKKIVGVGLRTSTKRLMDDLRIAMNPETTKREGYRVSLINDNLYVWNVELFGFKDCPLENDLKIFKDRTGQDFVKLEIIFSQQYPFHPPFIRVVSPHFKFHTGHITIGGSLCMELLTMHGWTPANDLEAVLIQIKAELDEGKAEIDFNIKGEYSLKEAQEAFERVARDHGWK